MDAFQQHCRDVYGVAFSTSIPGALTTRIPHVAVKVSVYRSLDTIEVHFYKSSNHRDRRRIIGWLVE